MKKRFRSINFRPDSILKITQMVAIVDEYQAQGLRLTARQLYYQFVSRDLIPNVPAEYKKLTALLTDARYAGLVDWAAIEDRGRVPDVPSEWTNIASLVQSALYAYRLPRWDTQPTYVELWVEKQALAGVLAPLAREFHVPLMVNKGYSSASAMFESARRINQASNNTDKPVTIFYLGDHDPSGEDMVRDIEARLHEFGCQDLTVTKIALTMAQVDEYNPPPNPAKISDPRAKAYIEKFGDSSWEVDALPPDVLAQLIRNAFEACIDEAALDAIKEQEEEDKRWLEEKLKEREA
jgi:hypothetical protein